MLSQVKEPHIDLGTGKIYNCSKGSWSYYHECGHRNYNDLFSDRVLINERVNQLWAWVLTTAFVISFFSRLLGFIFGLIALALVIMDWCFQHLEENYCNDYANKKWLKK